MSEQWTDEEFLHYFETHSQTERAQFSVSHVVRLLTLAGKSTPKAGVHSGFVSVHYETAKPLIDEAWKRIRRSRLRLVP